jgi:hypothetical protein
MNQELPGLDEPPPCAVEHVYDMVETFVAVVEFCLGEGL